MPPYPCPRPTLTKRVPGCTLMYADTTSSQGRQSRLARRLCALFAAASAPTFRPCLRCTFALATRPRARARPSRSAPVAGSRNRKRKLRRPKADAPPLAAVENVNCRASARPTRQRCHCRIHKSRPAAKWRKRIGVAAAGEVAIRQLHCTLVRAFRRGNNANNSNLSPLYVNANNAPSNTNTNFAFGNY